MNLIRSFVAGSNDNSTPRIRKYFIDGSLVSTCSIVRTILRAEEVVLLAYGAGKAEAVAAMVEGPLSAACPASRTCRCSEPSSAAVISSATKPSW